jgi:translocation protein SEC63
MSHGAGGGAGISGSDESFTAFAFAIVSVVMIVMYLPWLGSSVMSIYRYYTSDRKRRDDSEDPLKLFIEQVTYVPKTLFFFVQNPGLLVGGAQICWNSKAFAAKLYLPKFLKFVIRPRILVLWLWVVLLTSTMYATLTFDPHRILGVPTGASTAEIKKAYRDLTRINHPDRNSTDEARVIFTEVRRAYKSLVDREAFEEEESKNSAEFSVGVALPKFLTSRENDSFVLFGLLFVLIGLPIGVWYKFSGDKKILRLIKKVKDDRERLPLFLKEFGVPEDPKFLERQSSRQEIFRLLKLLKLAPAGSTDAIVANFPPLEEFISRALEPEKYLTALRGLGFDDEGIKTLNEYFITNGVSICEDFAKEHPPPSAADAHITFVSHSRYTAGRYLLELYFKDVNQALEELQQAMPGQIRSILRLYKLHEEVLEYLDLVYKPTKPLQKHIQTLIGIPQRVAEYLDELEPEIERVFQKAVRRYMDEQSQMKSLRRAPRSAGNSR